MIYITGDTHGDLSHFKDPKLTRLGEKDIVIVCGDFGFLWDPNDPKEKRNLEWLKKRKYTICFLDGAHENFDMLDSYTPYRWKGGNTHKIADNIYHLMRGEMFMFENKTFFVMGGGESEDKDMREDGVSWWKAELPTAEDLKNGQDNLREYKYAVNYVLTYEAPAIAKDFLKLHTNKGVHITPLNTYLQELMKQVEEKMYMKVTSVYGLTEAAPGMTATRIDDPFDVRCNTVGHDFEHTEVKVIDPETGEECPVGVQGEMCNRGYNTMKGYYKNPQATAEVIDKNGFLHSGDLGVKDEDGNYRITGRIKDMIIRGGENIYPREIEEFLYQLEGVKDVQVAGIPSKKYGEAVGAFIIRHEGADLHESDVRDFCIGKISRYKIPKYIFFVKEFPMTGSGKIQKFKLKDIGLQLCKEQGIEII